MYLLKTNREIIQKFCEKIETLKNIMCALIGIALIQFLYFVLHKFNNNKILTQMPNSNLVYIILVKYSSKRI